MPIVGSEKLEFAGDPQAMLMKPETYRQNNTLAIWLADQWYIQEFRLSYLIDPAHQLDV